MYRVLLLVSLILSCSLNVRAQARIADPRDVKKKIIIDKALLQITYEVRVAIDTIRVDSNRVGQTYYLDNQILEIGGKYNRYYSAFAENIDSVLYKVREGIIKSKGGGFDPYQNLNYKRRESGTYTDIFMHYPEQNKMTVYTKLVRKIYEYTEPVPQLKWDILPETDTIVGYLCHKAETEFRGLKWYAWFSMEIPYNYGPWKLGGLPGLILKAEDSDGYFKYVAIGLKQKECPPIYLYDEESIKCKREDVLKINNLIWKNNKLFWLTNGRKSMQYATLHSDGTLTYIDKPSVIYIPQLELE